jgi:hypothetical protein
MYRNQCEILSNSKFGSSYFKYSSSEMIFVFSKQQMFVFVLQLHQVLF